MQLILRVTKRCNFKCEFCSATQLSERDDLPLQSAIKMIERYNPDSVMLEGGDPLVMKPSYIKAILDYIDGNSNIKELGITTNLWNFWKRPQQWVDILKHPKVSVCTSFQYGDKRKISDKLILGQELFEKIYTKFEQMTGKRINFISVLDQDNEHLFDKTIEFAKKLQTYCKINPAFVSGRCKQSYPYYKAIQLYTKAILAGDGDIVDNCYTLMRVVMNQHLDTSCPHIRDCSNVFRIVSPDEVVTNCSLFGMSFTQINENRQLKWIDKQNKEIDVVDNFPQIVKPECLQCSCFDLCNGCRIKIDEIRNLENVDIHCETVKRCYSEIRKYIIDNNITLS